MVIEENPNANYLAHFKTKGAKNGIRRFQSYEVQPNPSGATGVEVGEAAAQRARMHGDSDDNQQQTYKSAKELRKETKRQAKLRKIAEKRKKKESGDKEKWAKSYHELRKHSDAFTNEELRRAIERLELEDRITGASLNSVRDKTQKGADILKNLDSAGRSMAGIYNTVAGGLNVYHEITGKGQKLPKFRGGNESIHIKKPDDKNKNKQGNKDQKFDNQQHQNAYESAAGKSHYNIVSPEDRLKKRFKGRSVYHASLSDLGIHLEHHGVKGQSWFTRHFQSYKTAPTRSGKVGVEVGLAAKQADRNGAEEEALDNSWKAKSKVLSKNGFKPYNGAKGSYYKNSKTNSGQTISANVWEHGEERENDRPTKDIQDFVNWHEDLVQNWDKKKPQIVNTYVDLMFGDNGREPWMFEKTKSGEYIRREYDRDGTEHKSLVNKEQAIDETKKLLNKMDATVFIGPTGLVSFSFEGMTDWDTMQLFGDHSIDVEDLDMKSLKSKSGRVSING